MVDNIYRMKLLVLLKSLLNLLCNVDAFCLCKFIGNTDLSYCIRII